jgi:hypothetical protein
LEAPVTFVSGRVRLERLDRNFIVYLLCKIDPLVIIILRTSIHARVCVLLVLQLVLVLMVLLRRGLLWWCQLLVTILTSSGVHTATVPIGNHRAGAQ